MHSFSSSPSDAGPLAQDFTPPSAKRSQFVPKDAQSSGEANPSMFTRNDEGASSPSSTDGVNTKDGSTTTNRTALRSLGQTSKYCSSDTPISSFPLTSTLSRPPQAEFSLAYDPYEVDRNLTLYYLKKFFAHVNSITHHMLLEEPFTEWVKTCATKSSSEKMLVYAILALATVFTQRQGSESHRLMFTKIAYEAFAKPEIVISLQLVQARLILALVAFSQGQYDCADGLCGSALRMACILQYQEQDRVYGIAVKGQFKCGLSPVTLAECKRQTFGAIYVMHRLYRCCFPAASVAGRQDNPLGLWSMQSLNKKSNVSLNAFNLNEYLDKSILKPELQSDRSPRDPSAHLIRFANTFTTVVGESGCLKFRPVDNHYLSFRSLYHDLINSPDQSARTVEQQLERRPGEQSGLEPTPGLGILHHYGTIVLCRYVRHTQMSLVSSVAHVREAYSQAQTLLKLVQQLCNDEVENPSRFRFATSDPIHGFAVLAALDIITAAGTLSVLMDSQSQILSLVSSGLEALDRLADYWHSARGQRDLVRKRVAILLTVGKSRAVHGHRAFFFAEPMQAHLGPDQDIIYGLPKMLYFQALGWDGGIEDDGDFVQLDAQKEVGGAT